jgi:mannose-1-phosphate guanylyltransferase
MRALLLAAGLGTRLKPLTDTIPKCLVPIHGVPLLNYWLELLLTDDAIERVLVNTHYRAEQVQAFVAQSKWRHRVDLVHEPALLGTAGTVLANREYFGDEPFLVAHADNLTRFDVNAFISRHETRPVGCEITMMTFETDSPQLCGIIEEDENGIIRAFHEKIVEPPGFRANAAVYIFEKTVIEFMKNDNKFYDISFDIIPHHINKIHTFFNKCYHRDIGNPESLERANKDYNIN